MSRYRLLNVELENSFELTLNYNFAIFIESKQVKREQRRNWKWTNEIKKKKVRRKRRIENLFPLFLLATAALLFFGLSQFSCRKLIEKKKANRFALRMNELRVKLRSRVIDSISTINQISYHEFFFIQIINLFHFAIIFIFIDIDELHVDVVELFAERKQDFNWFKLVESEDNND